MATTANPPATRNGFQIAVICALPEERDAVEKAMTRDYKDEGCNYKKIQGDDYHYMTGELGGKPIVLATPRSMGSLNASHLVVNMRHSFPNIVYALVVGIAGGAPCSYDKDTDSWSDSDIHLGDVIISTQVVEYDFGAELDDKFRRKKNVEDVFPRAPTLVTSFLNSVKTGKSKAFKRVLEKTNADLRPWGRDYERPACTDWHTGVCERALEANCTSLGCVPDRINESRETRIHFGRVASGNAVMKSAHRRDKLIQEEGCVAFEMEGAGTWEVLGTIVVKGVVDYADSHKNKIWRAYPAARAALCAKALIEEIELADPSQDPHTENLNLSSSTVVAYGSNLQILGSYGYMRLGIVGWDDPKADILQLIQTWLKNAGNGKWLLVLDNADEASYLLRPRAENSDMMSRSGADVGGKILYDYVPTCQHGSVIVTTRSRGMAADLVDDADIIIVQPMVEELAMDLLGKKLGPQADSTAAKQLVAALEKSAADLLSLMSFFDHQGIPESVLEMRHQLSVNTKHGNDQTRQDNVHDIESGSESSADELFEEDIITLKSYSFVSDTPDGTVFKMHRLVQVATRAWLKLHKQDAFWTQGRWKDAEGLEVLVMQTSNRTLGEEHPQTLTSMAHLAATYSNQGRWEEAEELKVSVMETMQKVLGEEHPNTLTSMANLAGTYSSQGRWKEAEELEVSVLKIKKKALGEDHPDTLMSMSNLAGTYSDQGRWKEAEELKVSVMETMQRVLGEEHPLTLTSMSNLALTYWDQERWEEAGELQKLVVAIQVKMLK
ncbi:hypothetical protein D6D04_04634 [Aureobasidium pullulans]|nr:hypothetical protein D6D04_04634 [Aureobasidium pullulans]